MQLFRIAIAVLLLSACARVGQAQALKIGIIEGLSGPNVAVARLIVDSARYGIDEINAAKGFNGRPIEIIEYDNRNDPAQASERFRQATEAGVQIIIQSGGSAIAGQLTEDVRRYNSRNPGKEILYITTAANAYELTGEKCHYFFFRTNLNGPTLINALLAGMNSDDALGKRVVSINENYGFGREVEQAILESSARYNYEVVDHVLHDFMKIQDFSPYAARIRRANASSVITANWSNDLLLLMKASGDSGLTVRFGTTFLDQPGAIGNAGAVAVGHFLVNPWVPDADKTDFAERYRARVGHMPAFVEPQTVDGMRFLGAALARTDTKDGKIDTRRIARALEVTEIETPVGKMRMRAEDHQAVRPLVVSRVVENARFPVDNTTYGFQTVRVVTGDEAALPPQASCQMVRPQ